VKIVSAGSSCGELCVDSVSGGGYNDNVGCYEVSIEAWHGNLNEILSPLESAVKTLIKEALH